MVRNVLNTLNLKECVITLDALHCQSETINTIVKQKATALIQVKANQGKLHESIDAQFQDLWPLSESEQGAAKEESTAHGRNEQRDAYVLPIKLNDKLLKKWPHLKTAIAIVRDRQVKGKTGTYSTSYYVCTSAITAEEALKIVRLHWGIENKLHWILDVTLKEDQSAVHDRIAAKNLASLRRVTLNLLRVTPLLEKKKEAPMTAKMMKAVFDINFRESIIFNLARG